MNVTKNPEVFSAEQFSVDEKTVKLLPGGPVYKDGAGIHTSVGGKRVNNGDWVLTGEDGSITVVSDEALKARYTQVAS